MATLAVNSIAVSANLFPAIKCQFERHPLYKNTTSTQTTSKFQPCGSIKLRLHTRHEMYETIGFSRHSSRNESLSVCAAALDVRCAAVQTLPRIRSPKTSTPTELREIKAPKLDQSGPVIPPNNGGGGGGGGGGGEGHWSGGFFLFAFLAFLAIIKENESESDYPEYIRKSVHNW